MIMAMVVAMVILEEKSNSSFMAIVKGKVL